jgi:hypothetical protein
MIIIIILFLFRIVTVIIIIYTSFFTIYPSTKLPYYHKRGYSGAPESGVRLAPIVCAANSSHNILHLNVAPHLGQQIKDSLRTIPNKC